MLLKLIASVYHAFMIKKKRGAEGPNIGHFQNRRRKVGYMISFALRRRLKSCILKKICNDTLIFVCPLSCDI